MTVSIIFGAISIVISIGGILIAVGRFSARVDEFEKNRDEYRTNIEKQFEKFSDFSKQFFDRIGKLEVWQGGQIERNVNHDRQFAEIKNELAEIKAMIQKLYEKN